jgi:thiol-disulfide isomerase/thioredoxin
MMLRTVAFAVALACVVAEDADVTAEVRKGENTEGVVPESPKEVLNAFFKEQGSQVLKLEENNFKMALDAYYKTIVYFYTPNCRLCVYLAPAFEKAAEIVAARGLSDERQVAFAKVDINSKRVIAEHFDITHVPILLVFTKGDAKGFKRYDSYLGSYNDGARTVSALVNYAMRIAGYPLQQFETEDDLINAKKTWLKYPQDRLVVGFIDEDDKAQKDVVVNLGQVAHHSRNTSFFLCRNKTIAEKFKVTTPGLLYLANEEPKRLDFPAGKEFTEDNIRNFAERTQVPSPVAKWVAGKGFQERRIWEETWDTHMVYVGKDDEEPELAAFTAACAESEKANDRGDILCVQGHESARRWELYRGDKSAIPSVAITKQGEKKTANSTKVTEVYRLEGKITKESVTKFRKDYEAGTLKQWHCTEAEDATGGSPLAGISYVVGSNFKSKMDGEFKDKNVVVMVSEPGWAGYCETGNGQDCPGDFSQIFANYQTLPEKFSSLKDVAFAQTDPRLNAYAHYVPSAPLLDYDTVLPYLIAKGPVYLFFPKGARDKPVEFEGDITKVEEISKFFTDNGVVAGEADTMDEL